MTPATPTTVASTTDPATRGAPADLAPNKLVLAYFLLSLVWALAGMLAGMFYSLQFLHIYPFAGIELCSPGRWRIVHTAIMTYGFVANAALGALHWMVPRITGRKILTDARSWVLLVTWQMLLTLTVTSVMLGHARAVPFGETPAWLAASISLWLLVVSVGALAAIMRSRQPRPIALWFLIISVVVVVPAYALGHFLPQHFGDVAAGTSDLSLATMAGLFLMPLGYAILYDVVPLITERPIWSPRLARIGWAATVLAFPLAAICGLLHGHGMLSARLADAIATSVVVIAAGTVMTNVLAAATVRLGSASARASLRWLVLGTLLYGVGCGQHVISLAPKFFDGAASSDWTIAHSHLVVFGTLGFWLIGLMVYVVPRLLGVSGWYRPSWHTWHFWLTGLGLVVMFVDLAAAGATQQNLWKSMAPWEQSLAASVPFWIVRTGVGFVIIAGHMVLLCHIAMTVIHCQRSTAPERLAPDATVPPPEPSLTAGALVMLLTLAGVTWLRWSDTTASHNRTVLDEAKRGVTHEFIDLAERFPKQFERSFPGGPTIESFAEALKLGRRTYEAEACWLCHTQRVRVAEQERLRWGSASQAAEYESDTQRLAFLATRRIGPDLSREAARRSNDWHVAHLFQPTDVVPSSVMPAYPWFFDKDDYPNRRELAVLTYLQWLGSDRPEYRGIMNEEPR